MSPQPAVLSDRPGAATSAKLCEILRSLEADPEIASRDEAHIIEFLEDRYRWMVAIADSLAAYTCLRGLDLLRPGYAASQLPSFPALLSRDMQAIMGLGDAKRAYQLAKLIQEAGLGERCDWMIFNFAISCSGRGMRKEAIELYRWVNDHGTPEQQQNAAGNLYFELAGTGAFDEIIARMEKCTLPPNNYPEALIETRQYDKARKAALAAFADSAKLPPDYVKLHRRMLGCGDLEGAVKALTPSGESGPLPGLAFLHTLYTHIASRVAQIRSAKRPATDGALGQVICWGEKFTHAFLDLTVPSLLQPGNFPRFASYKPVELRIMTDIVGRMIFKQDPRMRELEKHVTVSYELIPTPIISFPAHDLGTGIGVSYLVFGALWHLAVIEAMETGRDVFLIGADVIYSAGSWDYIGQLAAKDAEVIFACTFSANGASIDPLLRPYLNEDGYLDISHHELMDAAFRHLHPRSLGGFVTETNRAATRNLSYLFFPTAEGVTERVLAPTPLYLKHSALNPDAVFDFLTNDGQFIDRLFPEEDDWNRIYHITDNEQYCSLELSPPEKNTGEGEVRQVSPATIAAFADSYRYIRKMRRMITVEYRFRGTKPPPWPAYDATAFINELLSLLYEY